MVIPVCFVILALMCAVEAFNRRRLWQMLSVAAACVFFAVVLSP